MEGNFVLLGTFLTTGEMYATSIWRVDAAKLPTMDRAYPTSKSNLIKMTILKLRKPSKSIVVLCLDVRIRDQFLYDESFQETSTLV